MTSHLSSNLVFPHIRKRKKRRIVQYHTNLINLIGTNVGCNCLLLRCHHHCCSLMCSDLPSQITTLLCVHDKIVLMTQGPSTRWCLLKHFRLLIVLLCSCLELLVCVLNILLASSPFTDQQLQALQSEWPTAIGVDGRFNTLKALSKEAKVDYSKTKVCMVYDY